MSNSYEQHLFPALAEFCNRFLTTEGGDGDIYIITSNDMKKIAEVIINEAGKHCRLQICTEDHEHILLSDKSNENIIITNSWKMYDKAPEWVFLKIELHAPDRIEKFKGCINCCSPNNSCEEDCESNKERFANV